MDLRHRAIRESPEMLVFLRVRNKRATGAYPTARFNAGLY
jgi:hypothetical protein